MNNYSTSYDYSYEYASPSTYFDSPLLPPPCPVHSPYNFYTSLSMNLSPFSHTYYQQQQQSQVYPIPPVQQRMYFFFFQILANINQATRWSSINNFRIH